MVSVTFDTLVCEGVEILFKGEIIDSNDTYAEVFVPADGHTHCDTLYLLQIKRLPRYIELSKAFICPGEAISLGNQIISKAGLHTINLINQYGCDSILQYRWAEAAW